MKQNILIAALCVAACISTADPAESVAAYYTNVVQITNSQVWTNNTGGAYIAFEVAELGDLTETQSTGSLAALVFELTSYLVDRIQSMPSTNQPDHITIAERTQYEGGSTQSVHHTIRTERIIGTYSYPPE